MYYSKDLPANTKGVVKATFKNITPGRYRVDMYKTGYRANDAYTAYLDIGLPHQLSRQQVTQLQQAGSGKPASSIITISATRNYTQSISFRENDVLLITLNKL